MIEFIDRMLYLIWGDYAFGNYAYIFEPLNEILLIIFGCLSIYWTFLLWKFLLVGWWSK